MKVSRYIRRLIDKVRVHVQSSKLKIGPSKRFARTFELSYKRTTSCTQTNCIVDTTVVNTMSYREDVKERDTAPLNFSRLNGPTLS